MSNASFQIDVPEITLARARRGDMHALEQIYRAFERPAYTLALRMLGNADSAREIVHDAMLRMIERIGQFRRDAPFWGWLRQIVVNQALMHLRRERSVAFDELPDDDESPCGGSAPWALADAKHVERAMGRLPALTRSVLWLYHVEEYTHQEIAEMTGKSVSFSKSQVMRGGMRLRALLDPEFAKPGILPRFASKRSLQSRAPFAASSTDVLDATAHPCAGAPVPTPLSNTTR
ncbi:MAG: sigma-70 family RNA polymerase sigma factor [Rhodanobacteraceae bacterium]